MSLPRVPLTTNELKEALLKRENRDELEALHRLADKGSTSAQIIRSLGLTRVLVHEAFVVLRGKRKLQVNLARILGAARYKVLTQGRVYHVKCPKTYCYERDSFQHMVQCYNIRDRIVPGADVVPFLVEMARVTQLADGAKPIPYMVEYHPETAEEEAQETEEEMEREGHLRD